MEKIDKELCLLFSELLSYPTKRTKSVAADCERQLKETDPGAAAVFSSFISFLEQQRLPQIEEVFTATFDLQALSYPYVGFQLCGESQARTMFMMKLQELYTEQGFSSGAELPDHLGVMLGFIGRTTDPHGNSEIIGDALLPALEKILAGIEAPDQPYRQLIRALQIYLTNSFETELSEVKRRKGVAHG